MMKEVGEAPLRGDVHSGFVALWLRIGLMLLAVFLFVLILIEFLNFSNYRKTYFEMERSRYLVLAKDVRQSVVAGIDVGLAPGEDERLQPEVDDIKKRELGVRFIVVMDESGQSISSGYVQTGLFDVWRKKIASMNADAYWESNSADYLEIGLPYVNGYGVKSGAIVFGYDRAPIDRACDEMLYKLVRDTAVVFLVLTILTLSGAYALMYILQRQLIAAAEAIDGSLDATEVLSVIDDGTLDTAVIGGINEFAMLSQQAVREIARVEIEMIGLSSERGQKQGGN